MIVLPENPSLDDLDKVLRGIATGLYSEIENSQINAIKAMISLRLARQRLDKVKRQTEILDGFETV